MTKRSGRPRCLFAIAIGLLCSAAVFGQAPQPPSAEGREAMEKIAVLVGTWEGEGWMQRGPGDPSHFTSHELVESRLDGRVLLVEGRHHAKEGEESVHHALAVLSYDPTTKGYRFSSYLADGRSGDYPARWDEGNLVWTIATPNGTVRYTITVEGDRWQEIGEHSMDGETWRQFFAMDLTRRAD